MSIKHIFYVVVSVTVVWMTELASSFSPVRGTKSCVKPIRENFALRTFKEDKIHNDNNNNNIQLKTFAKFSAAFIPLVVVALTPSYSSFAVDRIEEIGSLMKAAASTTTDLSLNLITVITNFISIISTATLFTWGYSDLKKDLVNFSDKQDKLEFVVGEIKGIVSESSVLSSLEWKVGKEYLAPSVFNTIDSISFLVINQFESKRTTDEMVNVLLQAENKQNSAESKIQKLSKKIIDIIFDKSNRQKIMQRLILDFNVSSEIAALLYSPKNSTNPITIDKSITLTRSEKTIAIEKSIEKLSKKDGAEKRYFLASEPGLGLLLYSCLCCRSSVLPVHELETDLKPIIQMLNTKYISLTIYETKSSRKSTKKAIYQLIQRLDVIGGFLSILYPSQEVVKNGIVIITSYYKNSGENSDVDIPIFAEDDINISLQYT